MFRAVMKWKEKMMKIETLKELAKKLSEVKSAVILTHKNPDGDTTGAGLGLCYFLREIGVKANVKNSDGFPSLYRYIAGEYKDLDFEPETVISVDVADTKLLGTPLEDEYKDKIDLCIDHHFSNKMFARYSYVDGDCCATCLIIFEVIKLLKGRITPLIADCLYTGIATDTGCFMYEGTSPMAHRAAAELIEAGAHAASINREMFQIKSRGRILGEQRLISTMRFAKDDKIALITITNDIIGEFKIDRAELDGFAGIPLTVEGVKIGITLKQQAEDPGVFKASIRTVEADAAQIAAKFGGGGHIRAAGCSLRGSADEVAAAVIKAASAFV